MHYRDRDVSEPDPSPIIISKYLSEPGPTRRVPTGSDGLGSGIHPLVCVCRSGCWMMCNTHPPRTLGRRLGLAWLGSPATKIKDHL